MTFSLRFLGSLRSHSAISRSSRVVRPRGAVPFMGRVTMRRAAPSQSTRKKSSGEKERMWRPCCQCRNAPYVDRLARAQTRIQGRRAARRSETKWSCEVELIDVAGANPLVNPGDALGVFGFGERKLGGDAFFRG